MFFKKIKRNIIGLSSIALILATSCTIFAAAESTYTYYRFACSTTSASHNASATPIATVRVYGSQSHPLVGDWNDNLWIELDKKHFYGWASTGSGNDCTEVSSVFESTSSLKGNGSGTYRILFGKSSMLINGSYDLNSPKWEASVYIHYDK